MSIERLAELLTKPKFRTTEREMSGSGQGGSGSRVIQLMGVTPLMLWLGCLMVVRN
jgi:hypothetical protein